MSLLRAGQRSNQIVQFTHHINVAPLMQRNILRNLSTAGTEQPPQEQSSRIAPFLQTPSSSGYVYGKVSGTNRHTLKTDIINLLEASSLTPDNIKVAYNRSFDPMRMLVQFPSIQEYATAVRAISRRGRLIRLEKTDENEWELTKPYSGKYVLMQGLSLKTTSDDVHRFLDGFDYDSSSFEMFIRAGKGEPIKMVTVRFSSPIEAMNASIRKNRGFLNDNQVLVRVLQ